MLQNSLKYILFFLTALISFTSVVASEPPVESDDPLIIFAASSTSSTLQAIAETKKDIKKPKIVIGPSGTLARQIAAGAPADIFISANEEWIEYLKGEKRIGATKPLIGNRLVLAASKNHTFATLTDSLPNMLTEQRRIALADPKIAPLGRYSRDYLEQIGLWDLVKPKAAYSPSARQTLRLIENAGLVGFVYASDVVQSDSAVEVLTLAGDNAPQIAYKITLTTSGAEKPEAHALITHLYSKKAQSIWQAQGFSLLD